MTLSSRHERHLADILPGGSRISGSGSKRKSHDVETKSEVESWWLFRYECKCTQNKSYSFKRTEWEELVDHVYSSDAHERPAWAVRFYGPGEPDEAPVLKDMVVVDLNDWVELLEELESLRAKEAEQVSSTD